MIVCSKEKQSGFLACRLLLAAVKAWDMINGDSLEAAGRKFNGRWSFP